MPVFYWFSYQFVRFNEFAVYISSFNCVGDFLVDSYFNVTIQTLIWNDRK